MLVKFFIKLHLIFYVLLFTLLNSSNIQSQEKKLEYTCVLEQKENDIELTKSMLSTKVGEFLLGYISGIKFNYSGYSVKLITKGEISQIEKESSINIRYKRDKTLVIESGIYNYIGPNIENYKEKYTIKSSGSGSDFWKLFRALIIKSIKKKVRKKSKGVIIPSGNLIVKMDENGNIFISEIFNIYVF